MTYDVDLDNVDLDNAEETAQETHGTTTVVVPVRASAIKELVVAAMLGKADQWELEAATESTKGAANVTAINTLRWGAGQLRAFAGLVGNIPETETVEIELPAADTVEYEDEAVEEVEPEDLNEAFSDDSAPTTEDEQTEDEQTEDEQADAPKRGPGRPRKQ